MDGGRRDSRVAYGDADLVESADDVARGIKSSHTDTESIRRALLHSADEPAHERHIVALGLGAEMREKLVSGDPKGKTGTVVTHRYSKGTRLPGVDHQYPAPKTRQVRGGCQARGACADDDAVIRVGHGSAAEWLILHQHHITASGQCTT
jgi:hypothetical protein